MNDADAAFELLGPTFDNRLKINRAQFRVTAKQVLASNRNLVLGAFTDELVGLIAVVENENLYAAKRHAMIGAWYGKAPGVSMALMRWALQWIDNRPVLKYTALAFPIAVDWRVPVLLQRLGFEREGDLSIRWSK